MAKMILLYVGVQVVNVALNTLKTMWTANGSKTRAAVINAITWAFYTYVIVLTAKTEMSIVVQMTVVGAVNFATVYIVKMIDEKHRPDKVWKFEIFTEFNFAGRVLTPIDTQWATTQADSARIVKYCQNNGYKYFVTENRM